MSLIFVYGTLKRGDVRSGALADQTLHGAAQTVPDYRMYNCGSYPGLVDAPDFGLAIQGELYDVTPECLAQLDVIEGIHESLYERRPIRLQSPGGDRSVEAYFYLPSVTGLPDCGEQWIPHR